jgi:hypothetical protein
MPSRWRMVVQVLAFAAGLTILALFVHKALAPENRAKLDALWRAPLRDVAALFGLSMLSLGLNGAAFWITVLPVRRLRFIDVQATNAMATLLAYLPLKLSAVSRFVIHNRRDHVPIFTIAAWMGAVGIVLVASLGPPIGAAVWRGQIDPVALAVIAGGMALTYSVTLVVARTFAHAKGLGRLHRITDPLNIKVLNKGMHSTFFHNFHAGFAMLAHPWTLLGSMTLRTADLLVQAARFWLAARVVGVELSWEAAILIATTFFLTGVISPAGTLGTREGAATVAAKLLPGVDGDGFYVVTLVVSASEMLANAVFGTAGLVYLRPDRLLRGGHERAVG